MEVLEGFTAAIVFSNVFLQLLGCYLLWKTYNWTTITTQKLIIFNLSLCESLKCCYWSIYYLLLLNGFERTSSPMEYIFCVHLGSVELLYMLMVALTLDRLMNIVIGMRYSAYWTAEKTKIMLIIFWIIHFLWSLANVVIYYFKGAAWVYNATIAYAGLVKSIVFIMLAAVTYSVIFWKYKKSRESLRRFQSPDNMEINKYSSSLQIFRKSRFYVSVLIIFTYLLFIIIPYCVFAFLSANDKLLKKKTTTTEFNIAEILIHLSYTSDAIIYIFLQSDVRKTLLGIIYCCRDIQGENLHRLRCENLLPMAPNVPSG